MPKKVYTGTVISDKMDKTITVTVTSLVQHRRYQKTVKRVTKFKAHDPENRARVGDTVKIIESRPLSASKRWTVLDIVEKA
jgi:small subunit ribosomal protein S17